MKKTATWTLNFGNQSQLWVLKLLDCGKKLIGTARIFLGDQDEDEEKVLMKLANI